MLGREPGPGPPIAGDDLVEDEEDPVPAQDGLDPGPVVLVGDEHAADSHDRLAHEGRDPLGAELGDLRLELGDQHIGGDALVGGVRWTKPPGSGVKPSCSGAMPVAAVASQLDP